MNDSEKAVRIRLALERYEKPLVRYVARMTGDLETARDVVQDAFLRLCTVETLPGDDRLAPWLYVTCRNRALDLIRKGRPMNARPDEQLDRTPSPYPNPAAVLESKERAGRVTSALATLPEKQQEVVRLKFQGGLSYKQISEVTGHSVSNVGFLLHTAIRSLKDILAEKPAT